MLNSFPVAFAVSALCGALAGLGVGGGSLLILWLTLVLGMNHNDARILNLLFFLPSAVVASLFRWKQGSLHIKKVLPAIVIGAATAAACSLLSRQIDLFMLRKLWGGLLLITGIRELFYRPRKAK